MSVFFVHDPGQRIITPLDRSYRVRDIPPTEALEEINAIHEKVNTTSDAPGQRLAQRRKAQQSYAETEAFTEKESMGLAQDIMSSPVVSLPLDATLTDLNELMSQHKIHHVAVVDENSHIWALLSPRSILPFLLDYPRANPDEIVLEELCREPVISCSADSEIEDLSLLMLEHGLDGVPVINQQKLVGIVTNTDIVKMVFKEHTLDLEA